MSIPRKAASDGALVALLAAFVVAVLSVFGPSAAEGQTTDTQVRMVDFAFEPLEITVALGSTVTWVYDDSQCDMLPICEGHDTRAEVNGPDGKPLWDSPVFKGKGKTFTATMTQLGKIPYICTIHQSVLADMDGVINVVATAESPPTTAPPAPAPAPSPAPASAAAPAPSSAAAASVSPAVAGAELPNTGPGPIPAAVGFALFVAATVIGWAARTLRVQHHHEAR